MSSAQPDVPLTVMDHHDPQLLARLLTAVSDVAGAGAFTGGEAVERFEDEYASWCEVSHAVGVSSGTEALALALRALGVGAGDEVVVPANSFIATAEAVSNVGATPRFADVDLDTQLITADSVAEAMTPATRCVIPVHLFGRTVEMHPLLELTRRAGVLTLEDAAQAHGARYRGRRVGSLGDAGTFSFYPAKNLGGWGDGGAVVTNDAKLAERVRLLRSHGENPRYDHREIGTTARLDAIQAAVLRVKLPELDDRNARRRELAAALSDALGDLTVLRGPARPGSGADHVYHQFVIRACRRDSVKEMLKERGIASGVHYPIPIHRSQAYAHLREAHDPAPNATRLAGEILSLPMFPSMSAGQVERIAVAIGECEALQPSSTPALVR